MAHKCEKCDRDFNTEEGFNQHNRDKHEVSRHGKKEAKKEREEQKMVEINRTIKSRKNKRTAIAAAFVAVLIGLTAFMIISLPHSTGYSVIRESGDNFLGPENASVTVVEFSDFQCPFCGQFFAQTEEQLISSYVDTGQVKFVYKHFPLTRIHTYAQKAAEASECAADQGMFWEYHDKLFENQNDLFTSSLKKYAAEIGLNTTAFDACLDSGAMAGRVSADMNEGISRGVSSTPTFFVNNVRIQGAQPISSFRQAIEAELGRNV